MLLLALWCAWGATVRSSAFDASGGATSVVSIVVDSAADIVPGEEGFRVEFETELLDAQQRVVRSRGALDVTTIQRVFEVRFLGYTPRTALLTSNSFCEPLETPLQKRAREARDASRALRNSSRLLQRGVYNASEVLLGVVVEPDNRRRRRLMSAGTKGLFEVGGGSAAEEEEEDGGRGQRRRRRRRLLESTSETARAPNCETDPDGIFPFCMRECPSVPELAEDFARCEQFGRQCWQLLDRDNGGGQAFCVSPQACARVQGCNGADLVCQISAEALAGVSGGPCAKISCPGIAEICVVDTNDLTQATCVTTFSTGDVLRPGSCLSEYAAAAAVDSALRRAPQVIQSVQASEQSILQSLGSLNEFAQDAVRTLDAAIVSVGASAELFSTISAQAQRFQTEVGEIQQRLVDSDSDRAETRQLLQESSDRFLSDVAGVLSTREAIESGGNLTAEQASLIDMLDAVIARATFQSEIMAQSDNELEATLVLQRDMVAENDDLRLGIGVTRVINAMLESAQDAMLEATRLRLFASNGTRGLGYVPFDEGASSYWFRFTMLSQFAVPNPGAGPLSQAQKRDLADQDPDMLWALSEQPRPPFAAVASVLDNYVDAVRNLAAGPEVPFLALTSFEFKCHELVEKRGKVNTFHDIMKLLGPRQDCTPPTFETDFRDLDAETRAGLCECWVEVVSSRCVGGGYAPGRLDQAFTTFADPAATPCPDSNDDVTSAFFDVSTTSEQESRDNSFVLTRRPRRHVVTNFTDVNFFLRAFCQLASPGILVNSDLYELNASHAGVWLDLAAAPSFREGACSTHWSEMEREGLEGVTLPNTFYQMAQLSAQRFVRNTANRQEVVKYGTTPLDVDIFEVPVHTRNFAPQLRAPDLEPFRELGRDARNLEARETAETALDPPETLKCLQLLQAYVDNTTVPVYRLSYARTEVEGTVSLEGANGSVFFSQTVDAAAVFPFGSSGPGNSPEPPSSMLYAGWLYCLGAFCGPNSTSSVFDTSEDMLDGSIDPRKREGTSNYLFFLLENTTAAASPDQERLLFGKERRFVQNQGAAFKLECSFGGACSVGHPLFNPQATPTAAFMRRQMGLTRISPSKLGPPLSSVQVELEPRDASRPGDPTWRRCAAQARAQGEMCTLLESHKLVLPVLGGADSLDAGGELRMHMLDFFFALDIVVPGQLVALADSGRTPLCPPAGWTEVRGAAGDGASAGQALLFRTTPGAGANTSLVLRLLALPVLQLEPDFGTVPLGREAVWQQGARFELADLDADPRSQPGQDYIPCNGTGGVGWAGQFSLTEPLSIRLPAFCDVVVAQLSAGGGAGELCWTYLVNSRELARRTSDLATTTTSADGGPGAVQPFSAFDGPALDQELLFTLNSMDDMTLRALSNSLSLQSQGLLSLGDVLVEFRVPPGGHAAVNNSRRQALADALNSWGDQQSATRLALLSASVTHEEVLGRLYTGAERENAVADETARLIANLIDRIGRTAADLNETAETLFQNESAIRNGSAQVLALALELLEQTRFLEATYNNTGDINRGWSPATSIDLNGRPVYDIPSVSAWERFGQLFDAIGDISEDLFDLIRECFTSGEEFKSCVGIKKCRFLYIPTPCNLWAILLAIACSIGALVLLFIVAKLYTSFRPNGTNYQRRRARMEKKKDKSAKKNKDVPKRRLYD